MSSSIASLRNVERPRAGFADLWFASTSSPVLPVARLETLLDPEERQRAGRFLAARDRQSYIASHGILRLVLAAYLTCDPASVSIHQPPDEKPRLAAGQPPLEFNLSHSGDLTMVGVGLQSLGVDVEEMRDLPELNDIAARSFAPEEAAVIANLPAARRHDAFFACWTCKEAVVKAIGRGLAMPLGSFVIAVEPSGPPTLRSIDGSVEAAADWSLWSHSPAPAYQAAAAVAARDVAFAMHMLA